MRGAADFDRIADFRFVRLLGSGSFAHTYEAERGGEQFAVKVFYDLPATAEAQERFRREVSSLRIEHPNLAEYVESGVAACGGRPAAYIAMRYLPGRSLRQHLAECGGGSHGRRRLTSRRESAPGCSACTSTVSCIAISSQPTSIFPWQAG
jgi:serine/threonine protein kinase